MATLYWGGGTGTWSGSGTANWYTDFARTILSTRAPSAEDDVIFDSSSSATAYTVTLSASSNVGGPACQSITISGPASGNITFAGSVLFVYGNFTLSATGITYTQNGGLYFYGSGNQTITTNGISITSFMAFSGSGTYTLQDALTNTVTISISNGKLDTNNKSVTVTGSIFSTGDTPKTLTLGSSSISAQSLDFSGPVTINPGTSSITLTNTLSTIGSNNSSSTWTGGSFYNVIFSSNEPDVSIYGNNTFNNLTFTTAPATAYAHRITFYDNQTVSGTLTVSGSNGANRVQLASSTIGVARTLTVAAVSSLTDVDFRDITVTGASAPWSGTRLGDGKGNTSITFGAGKTVYVAGGQASSTWGANIWASASGGGAAVANFPLPQDTVILDDAGFATSATLTLGGSPYMLTTLNAASRTNALTINGYGFFFLGDLTFGAAIATANTGSNFYYCGRITQNITSAGKSLPGIVVNSPAGTVKLIDNVDISSINSITLTNGTFDANNKNVTCNAITASGTAAKTLTLGSGTYTTSNSVGVNDSTLANLTVSSTTATINVSTPGTAYFGFSNTTATFGGTVTFSNAGSGCQTVGTTTVANLTLIATTTTGVVNKLQLGGNLTVTGTLALGGGTSVTQRASVVSDTLGTQRTLSAATVTGLSDIDFRDTAATGAANWTTGTRLGDCGGNSGITFPAAKTVYWNLTGTQNWSATAWAPGSGGTPAVNNFPLAQDTAVFDNAGAATTVSMNASWNIGTINASARTTAITFSSSTNAFIYGDITYGSGVTVTATRTFIGTGIQTYTSAGKTSTGTLTVNKPSGELRLGDACTITGDIIFTRGTFRTQNYNFQTLRLNGSNSTARTVDLGTSTVTVTGGTAGLGVDFRNSTNLTFVGSQSTIVLTSSSNKVVSGQGLQYGTINVTGGSTSFILQINNGCSIKSLTNTARMQLRLREGQTTTFNSFTYSGVAGTVPRFETFAPGQRATFRTISNTVGANSIDGGNNAGLSFTGASPNYLYVRDISFEQYTGGRFFLAM